MRTSLNNPVKGTHFEKKPSSILYLGQSVSGEEMWLTPDQVKTHIFLSGSTGSGKTEMLTNIMTNAMAWGSGALFIDGKGDINFFAKLHLIAKALGREQDLLLLNFMKGNVRREGPFASHTINPFGFLSADELCQIMSNMLAPVSGDGVMWRERAISLMNAIINSLAWLRDAHGEPLTISKIRTYLVLPDLINLSDRLKAMIDAPSDIVSELDFYLASLPGYRADKGAVQSQTTLDQHGYLSMQWTRTATLLCTNYGHILDVGVPDIDIRDVILNRRILVILLPSLERSSSDIRNIGALMVGMIKSMLGQALRTPVEGSWRDVVEDRITNARNPFLILMDEVGQYISDGMGMMAQQARSLNIGLVFATQDFDSLHYTDMRETEAIIANTNTKIFMKAENPTAPQISRVLSTYITKQEKQTAREMTLYHARSSVVRDRLHYLHHRRNEELGRSLDDINVAHSDFIENDDDPDLMVLLRGFKTGQMLCTHGADCVQGTANYIALETNDHPHAIRLEHYVNINDYGTDETKQNAIKARANSITANLKAEIAQIEAKKELPKDFAKMVAEALGLGKLHAATVIHFAEPPAFPTGVFDGRDPLVVWSHYISSIVLASVNLARGTYFSKLRDEAEEEREKAMAIPANSKQKPFDLLKFIKDA